MPKHPFIETAELLEEILEIDKKIVHSNRSLVVLTETDRRRIRHEAKRYRRLAEVDETK